MITIDQLDKIINWKISDKELLQLRNSINLTFRKFHINTKLQQRHFLAQICWESGCFRYKEEIWGNTNIQKTYQGRMGNIHKGDGYKYRGRGFIQLTGRNNYTLAAKYFNEDFISNPELVSDYPYNCYVAGWYWDKNNLNKYADANNIKTITKRINGGYSHLDKRIKWYDLLTKII
jgi:putative chitinase